MGSLLGAMFLGLSVLAAHMQVVPFERGTPTVISQVGRLVYGTSPAGHALFFALQASTMLILVLAANTSFADFPRLASFHAWDNFMPRQLTKRGHRLVFSSGFLFLSGSAMLLVLLTGARVGRLIPLYAIGVFTSFTLSQAGMARHHLREKEPGWRSGLAINATGAVLTTVVDIVIAVTKFTHGAWVIVVLVPIMVVFLVRLARQDETEAEQLEHNVPQAVEERILRRHVVLVFVDRLDLAAARAVQYARTLVPTELRAVHFVLHPQHADDVATAWSRYGLSGVALDLVDCPDRRLTRSAVTVVARDLADRQTEVTVLLPDRRYSGVAAASATPFRGPAITAPPVTKGLRPIASVRERQRVVVEGRVRSVRVVRLRGSCTLECVIKDGTGALSIVFLGRPRIAGVEVRAAMRVSGTAGRHQGRLAILNPDYRLLHGRP